MINTERLVGHAAYVSLVALQHSKRAAIINTGALTPLGITHEAIARKTMGPEHLEITWQLLSIEKILRSGIERLPAGTNGLLVTGYSATILDQGERENENRLQAAIRAKFNSYLDSPFSLLVLSETLPNKSFEHISLPWYNGPFQPNTTWSIEPLGPLDEVSGFSLTQHHLGHDKGRGLARVWSNIGRFEFALPKSS